MEGEPELVELGKRNADFHLVCFSQLQALIDGPETGVPRQAIAYRKVVLTPYVLKKLPRSARSGTLSKVWKASDVESKWEKSAWNKKRQLKARRAALTDFERFKVQALKSSRSKIVSKGASTTVGCGLFTDNAADSVFTL